MMIIRPPHIETFPLWCTTGAAPPGTIFFPASQTFIPISSPVAQQFILTPAGKQKFLLLTQTPPPPPHVIVKQKALLLAPPPPPPLAVKKVIL